MYMALCVHVSERGGHGDVYACEELRGDQHSWSDPIYAYASVTCVHAFAFAAAHTHTHTHI